MRLRQVLQGRKATIEVEVERAEPFSGWARGKFRESGNSVRFVGWLGFLRAASEVLEDIQEQMDSSDGNGTHSGTS